MNFLPQYPYFVVDFGEILHSNVYAMPFDNSEFRKNRYIGSQTLLGDTGELCPIF